MEINDAVSRIYRFDVWIIAKYRRQMLDGDRKDVWERVWNRIASLLNEYEFDAVRRAFNLLGP